MTKKKKEINEENRLKELREFKILDTEPEVQFDNIIELASQICNVPVSLISLVDENRQWFKAKKGLDAQETPRDIAFCSHAILDSKPFVVEDATQNELFSSNPLVTNDPSIVFYAGIPLSTSRGNNIGTLCVIDFKKNNLTSNQLKSLNLLAEQVVFLIETRSKNESLYSISTALKEARRERDTSLIQLKEANEEVAKALKVKGEFLATMGHEIRTPINAIYGMSTLLLNSKLNTNETEKVQTITKSCEHLLNLVNDILDFSKLESNKFEIELQVFNFRDAMKEVISIYKVKSLETDINLNLSIATKISKYIRTDLTRLRQILLNLISNSFKFTKNGQINLNINTKNDKLIFQIEDTGIGISKKNVKELFNPFRQADNTISRKYGGTGLGLAICKSLTELLGGEIYCESSIGNGSKFTFLIKYEEINEIVSQTVEITNTSYTDGEFKIPNLEKSIPLTILVAEDNIANQILARSIFKELGYIIDIASNGVDVLDMISIKKYDVIFMDVQMPDMNGIEATKLLHKILPDPDLRPKIIAMTANTQGSDKKVCLDAGMDDFIPKPVLIGQIVKCINYWFSSETDLGETQIQINNSTDKLHFNPRAMLNYQGLTHEDGTDLFQFILNKFRESFESEIEVLYSQSLNKEETERLAHTLKSNARSIGAENLGDFFEQIELSVEKLEDLQLPEKAVIIDNYKLFLKEIPSKCLK